MAITDKHSLGGEQWTTTGGGQTVTVPSGAGNTPVKSLAGRLCRVLVTATGTGTGNVLVYDNASAASGTVIGVIPANATVGSIYEFQMPCANGIVVANVANGPSMTVSYY